MEQVSKRMTYRSFIFYLINRLYDIKIHKILKPNFAVPEVVLSILVVVAIVVVTSLNASKIPRASNGLNDKSKVTPNTTSLAAFEKDSTCDSKYSPAAVRLPIGWLISGPSPSSSGFLSTCFKKLLLGRKTF